ncbi:MAG: cache domain-containing protein [Desulfobacteraceae bacterium]
MNFRFSITFKLLLLVLPLVCVPIATVGYLSYRASVERVNRLVRQEQMVKVQTTAKLIDDLLNTCRVDINTLSSLPILSDFHLARSFRLEAEAEFNRTQIVRIFEDFIARAPCYYRIRYLDAGGKELIRVGPFQATPVDRGGRKAPFIDEVLEQGMRGVQVSEVTYSEAHGGYLIHWAAPIFTAWQELAGLLIIDLDYESIMKIVGNIQVGETGYAFLVDGQGKVLAHPEFEPYELELGDYSDPSLESLVKDMAAGGSGWRRYTYQGESKMAAFTPIPGTGWSLAATISSGELLGEAGLIRTRVLQVVLAALFFAVTGICCLSYLILKPVGDLAAATRRIAGGDLDQELKVRSRDELGELTSSFNRMVRELSRTQAELVRSEKLISLGRLSAGVAHEIRNPLNAMKGAMVHLKKRRPEDPLVQEYTDLVSEEIDRLNTFVSEFLYFARQSTPRVAPTDINRLIESVQGLFEEQASQRGVRFVNALDPGLPPLLVDRDQMEQVLLNLLVNAMDAMPRGGEVHFSSGLSNNGDQGGDGRPWARIVIRDQGGGIPPEHLKSIFDPFFSTKDMGTGLGLPLSLGILESHGGVIRISSRLGSGTKVTVEWPARFLERQEREKSDVGQENSTSR